MVGEKGKGKGERGKREWVVGKGGDIDDREKGKGKGERENWYLLFFRCRTSSSRMNGLL